MLRSELARDANFLMRFRREAQSAAGLNHPAIVAIFDSGEDDASSRPGGSHTTLPYIVMEYVDGQTLRQNLSAHEQLDPSEAIGSPRASSTRWPTATGWASSTATSSRPTS